MSEMTFPELTAEKGIRCSCGRVHRCGLKWFRAGKGVIEELPAMLECCGRKYPMLVMDPNTKKAAGDRVMQILDEAGISHVTIETLRDKAYSLVGTPDKLEWEDQVVAIVEARDGTILDVVRKVKPLVLDEN